MLKYDPRKVIEGLRDHLSRHDKPIAFFLGAGTSCAVARRSANEKNPGEHEPLIPAVRELTEICADEVASKGEPFKEAWKNIEKECEDSDEEPNIENILSRVQMKLSAIGEGDRLVGLDADGLRTVDQTIRGGIAKAVLPNEDEIPLDLPHTALAKWIVRTARRHPVEIFTLNYDIIIERSLEAERIPVFDGFVGSYRPFFHSESLFREQLAPGMSWVRLWKIHGSVNWKLQDLGGQKRIIRGEPHLSGEMIFPTYLKYDESRKQPYFALLQRLQRFLDREDSFVVSVGYSFGDQHINDVIFDTLESRLTRTHVFALQFSELDDNHDLIRIAKRCPNLVVLGPKTGVIGGKRGEWELSEPVDEGTADLMDIAFDSDAVPPDDEDEVALTGLMRLGDFNFFCKFLGSMAPQDEGK